MVAEAEQDNSRFKMFRLNTFDDIVSVLMVVVRWSVELRMQNSRSKRFDRSSKFHTTNAGKNSHSSIILTLAPF